MTSRNEKARRFFHERWEAKYDRYEQAIERKVALTADAADISMPPLVSKIRQNRKQV
jgi:hypothetical protein